MSQKGKSREAKGKTAKGRKAKVAKPNPVTGNEKAEKPCGKNRTKSYVMERKR